MARVFVVRNTTVGAFAINWVVERDAVVVRLTSNTNVLLTRDIQQTQAQFAAPLLADFSSNEIAWVRGSDDKSAFSVEVPAVPVFKDEVILVAFAAVGSAMIYLNDA